MPDSVSMKPTVWSPLLATTRNPAAGAAPSGVTATMARTAKGKSIDGLDILETIYHGRRRANREVTEECRADERIRRCLMAFSQEVPVRKVPLLLASSDLALSTPLTLTCPSYSIEQWPVVWKGRGNSMGSGKPCVSHFN